MQVLGVAWSWQPHTKDPQSPRSLGAHSLVEISPMTSWLWILLNYQKDPKGIERAYSTRNTITFISMAKIVAHREWSEVSSWKFKHLPGRMNDQKSMRQNVIHPSVGGFIPIMGLVQNQYIGIYLVSVTQSAPSYITQLHIIGWFIVRNIHHKL